MKVYLAGNISGCSHDSANEWRENAERLLDIWGITAASPMRDVEMSEGILKPESQTRIAGIVATSRSIMMRDYNDVITSDALLVNLDAPVGVSGGTMAELAWAYHLRIPTVVICPKVCYYTVHPMAAEMIDFRVDTLEEGIRVIRSVLCL